MPVLAVVPVLPAQRAPLRCLWLSKLQSPVKSCRMRLCIYLQPWLQGCVALLTLSTGQSGWAAALAARQSACSGRCLPGGPGDWIGLSGS